MNIQVTHGASVNNAHSESSLAINPNNPMQVVAASKKFNNIHTYDFTLATEYSTDGGATWHDSTALGMVGFTVMTDPTLAWDDQNNVYLLGLSGTNPPEWDAIGMVVYKSTDGGKTWSAPKPIHNSAGDDKQWLAGDTNPASPFHGRVYGVWDETSTGQIFFARTKDHGANWVGPGAAASPPVGPISSGSVFPEINVAQDGTIYVASIAGSTIKLMISTDGGDTFQPTADPATGISPLGPPLPSAGGFPVFPGGNFRVITDPTCCAFGNMVIVAWADLREGVSRIYYALSNDRGAHWTTGASGHPLLTVSLPSNFQHFHPQIVVDPFGAVGCSFYEFGPKPSTNLVDLIMAQSFDGGSSFIHFTVTDQPWDPTIDAPWSHGNSAVTFIGDYMGLDASSRGFFPLWTDTRTGIQELFTSGVPERRLQIIVERSTIGQDEVDARRLMAGGGDAIIPNAFRVVVDGYNAAQLGISGSGTTLNVASPSAGMTIHCSGNVSATGGYGAAIQRFTFNYDINFGTNPSDPAFNFPAATKFLTLNAAIAEVSGSAQIELIKQPDPFMLHGDPTWLSVDLRTFVVRPGDVKFGVTMGSGAADAPNFIQHVAKALSNGNGSAGGQSFDDPAVLSPDEEQSALFVFPQDQNHRPVFNFALARVRYIGLIGAANVRVFFRLFNAQTTSGVYDFPPGHRYRRVTNTHGDPIPLPGIQGSDYSTMPFFALPRINSASAGMNTQTDSHVVSGVKLGNIQTITAHANGTEVDTFFGCWLDINQSTPVLPAQVDTVHPDGPYLSASNPPLPIQQAILRNRHQCLIAEVAFDPISIPVGKDPSNWDKLAQRNLAWSDIGSATAVTTFEVRPTPAGLAVGQTVDELMIDWGATPHGSTAMIYLPEASADEMLRLAGRMYVSHGLSRVDDHTLKCQTGGISYLPIPAGSDIDYAGLLTIEPPSPDWHGRSFTVVVRQVTNAYGAILKGEIEKPRPAAEATGRRKAAQKGGDLDPSQEGSLEAGGRGGIRARYTQWRKVMGAFQLTVPVKEKAQLLPIEERTLAVLRWVGEAIPAGTRWHSVFRRYLDVIAGRVKSFGGDPGKIKPSPTGTVGGDHDHGGGHGGHGDHDHDGRFHHTGKISGLIFDHFGDFEGFMLETEHGSHRYHSREKDLERLVREAWRERLRVGVRSGDGEHVIAVAVLTPPVIFRHDHEEH